MGKRRDTSEELTIHLPPDADIEIEAPFSEDEVTPRVLICPDCGHDQVDTGEHLRLPEDYGEATAILRCCGTTDPRGPRWCRTTFTATWPREGRRVSFDKRKARP